MQPHTSGIITDRKKVTLITSRVLKLLVMLLLLLRDLFIFSKRGILVGYLWLLQIKEHFPRSHRCYKRIWKTRNCSSQSEPREKLKQKIAQTMLELVRWIQNINVFMKKLIRAATDCFEESDAFDWSSVIEAFCNRLSKIEHANSRGNAHYLHYLRRKNIPRVSVEQNLRGRQSTEQNICSKCSMSTANLSTPWQESRRLGF